MTSLCLDTMSSVSLDRTVGQLVAERPSRSLVFERLGIDYCCGGKSRLRDACANRGLDPDTVLQELAASDREPLTEDPTDWSETSMAALTDHIVEVHHRYLRTALPRLSSMLEKVVRAHGERHPELPALKKVFAAFQVELDTHMLKEERVLFPMCRELETARTLPEFHCGTVKNPILVMTFEHEDAGDALAAMRNLTHDFTPPADACNTYRALLDGLAELERDMHQHVHKENNILFPKAIEAEESLAARR